MAKANGVRRVANFLTVINVARTAAIEHRYSMSVVCMALLLKVNTRVRTLNTHVLFNLALGTTGNWADF